MRINHLLHFIFFQTFFVVLAVVSIGVFTDRDFSKDLFVTKNSLELDGPWIFLGGLTSDSARFRIRRPFESKKSKKENSSMSIQFFVAKTSDFASAQIVFSSLLDFASGSEEEFVASIKVPDLVAGKSYIYGLTSNNITDASITPNIPKYGSFTTPAKEGSRFNFTVAVSGCALTGSHTQVFRHIIDKDPVAPLLFLHTGDFHYEDLSTLDFKKRIQAIDRVMASPTQRYLFAHTALVYMWDDHDFLGDNSFAFRTDESNLSHQNNQSHQNEQLGARDVALQSYHEAFPYYEPLPSMNERTHSNSAEIAPYHAFTIGTVRFIVTDLRSESSPTQIYSDAQRAWLYSELTNSTVYDYVVWMNTKPWMDLEGDSDDAWSAYPDERQNLSNHIAKSVTQQNLLVVSGDAHMTAFDDGTHTYYGTENASIEKSFPLLQSGPLDKLGSMKGGPYSHGCHTFQYERNHQYSTLSFYFPSNSDQNNEACVRIESHSIRSDPVWKKNTLLFNETFCGSFLSPSTSQPNQDSNAVLGLGSSCTINKFTPFTSQLSYVAIAIFVLNLFLIVQQRQYIQKTGTDLKCKTSTPLSVAIVYIVFSACMILAAGSPIILRVKALESALAITFWIVHGVATFVYLWFW